MEQNLGPAAEGDCVFVLLFARVPSGQGGASSLINALLEEPLLLRLFLWFWVYLFLLNCSCGWLVTWLSAVICSRLGFG